MLRDKFLVVLLLIGSCLINSCKRKSDLLSNDMQSQCLQDLRELLVTQTGWIKVHVAEYLIWTGYPEGVQETFLEEAKEFGNIPKYRIGIWRVLAQSVDSIEEKERYIASIMDAFRDIAGDDRVHAAETLAKLGVSTVNGAAELTKKALEDPWSPLGLYTKWSTAYTNSDSLSEVSRFFYSHVMARAGEQPDAATVKLMAFVLGQLNELAGGQWTSLAEGVLSEPDHNVAKPNLLRAVLITAPEDADHELLRKLYTDLLRVYEHHGAGGRMQLLNVIAQRGLPEHIEWIINIYKHESDNTRKTYDADLHATAAYALLSQGSH